MFEKWLEELPKGWHEITVGEFIELQSVLKDELSSYFSVQIDRLCILLGVDIEEFDEYDIDELAGLFKSIKFLNKDVPKGNKTAEHKPFEKITFGEFIDIEHFSKDVFLNYSKIIATLCKRKSSDKWGFDIYEPQTSEVVDRFIQINEEPILKYSNVFDSYFKWRSEIYSTYKVIFQTEDEEEELEGLTEEEIQEIKEAEKEEEAKREWIWHLYLHKLTNGDITKQEEVLSLPVIQIFNNLTALKALGLNEN